MTRGILALVERSLRVDARSWQTHLARLALMVAIYVALCVALREAGWFGAPGLRFFYSTAYLDLAFMSLLGIGFFSTSVSEEKEEDTLGLMLMAGISPLGILIGKSGGRLIQALILIAVQYPFTQLAITMGGVTALQVNAAYVGLTAYLILLAGFGLLCSTIGRNNRSASTLMTLGLAVYTLIPLTTSAIVARMGASGPSFGWIYDACQTITKFSIFQQMGMILTSGFGDPTFSFQVISNVSVGCGCFVLSWLLFGLATRNPASEARTRGALQVSRQSFRLFSPGRAWGNPFLWKDFYFVSGGLAGIPVRIVFCAGLWFLVAFLNKREEVTAYQVFLSLAIAIDAGRVMAGSLNDELRGQTLASLAMLPRPIVFVVYSKLAGAMLVWIPAALLDLLIALGTPEGQRNLNWMLDHPMGFCITSFFVLIPHLAAVLSLYMRWGATPLGTALGMGAFFGTLSVIRPVNDRVFGLVIGCMVIAICMGCHMAIALRVRSLAEK